jgi:hypothetical protein
MKAGADWNHGIWIDFPLILGIIIIPTEEVYHFSEGWRYQPPDFFGMGFWSKKSTAFFLLYEG